jgi:3-hydroxyacyl-[acyl-carrier-protein] dehydratase
MVMENENILAQLPYEKPFLFVDELISINENGVVGTFTFHQELDFFKGHFKDFPVTPGVILIETMAQIGLVCLGIYLLAHSSGNCSVAMTSSQIDFLKPVFPNEKVKVTSEKLYFRFNKLSCSVKMENEAGMVVCKGTLAGMLNEKQHD